MSPPGKKRPIRSGRQAPRDPRTDSAPPARDDMPVQASTRPPSARIALLEAELARVNQERADEADDLATMLVRIADAERAKAASELLAKELAERVTTLDAQLGELKDPPPSTEPDPRVRELASDLDAARLRLGEMMGIETRLRTRADELERRVTEAQAMANAQRSQAVESEAGLKAALGKVKEADVAVQMATSRAGLAEKSAADGATAVQRVQAELAADRARLVDLEAKLARVKREHSDALQAAGGELATALEGAARKRGEEILALEAKYAEALRTRERLYAEATTAMRVENARMLTALREEHAGAVDQNRREHAAELDTLAMSHNGELQALARTQAEALKTLEERHAHTTSAMREEHAASKRSAGRALEEERSAAARAKLQVVALEASVTSQRATAARAAQLLDELGRREEAASAARAHSLEQAKRVLAGEAGEAPAEGSATPASPGARPRSSSGVDAEPSVERGSLDEIEIDLAD